MDVFTVENLSFRYPDAGKPALRNVSFSVKQGEFIVLCGATGSGKSTLLRLLKRELSPLGERDGTIRFYNETLDRLTPLSAAADIGFVAQQPEQQLVTDKVWHELAFGLENLALPRDVIRRRVAEMASYFGIGDWFDRPVNELSGGQKQLLNLAAVMVMQPQVLLLDEPTAQLDPIAATEFIATLQKLNRELSLTVILAEHRLEEAVPACNRLMVLENGGLRAFDEPHRLTRALGDSPLLLAGMPAAVRLFNALSATGDCPLTVREGREFVETHYAHTRRALSREPYVPPDRPALEFRDVWFRYARALPDVLRGLTLTVGEGEIFCLLGGNGSGKTTAVGVAAGWNRPYSGTVRVFGQKWKDYRNQSLCQNGLAMLPQDVQTVFLKNTVREELADAGIAADELPFDLSALYDQHPYDLSGGEQQLVALAKVLAQHPRLLLLDEPTKGLDAVAKQGIGAVLRQLKAAGVTLVLVTHDVEFAAEYADRCALIFHGEVAATAPAAEFFAENSFYTTAISRMTRGWFDGAVTVADAVTLCRENGGRS